MKQRINKNLKSEKSSQVPHLLYQIIHIYRIVQNVGRVKHWRIWRLSIDSPKFSHPKIVIKLKCNGKPTQFVKVLPSNYTSRVISPKFHSANILHYTVHAINMRGERIEV